VRYPYVPQVPGPESAVSFFDGWLRAFPDAEVICEEVVAAGTPAAGVVVGNTADWLAQLEGADPQARTGAAA
jgi:hypothetical protein